MHDGIAGPDSTAARVALWRAMHVQLDPPPHVLEDEIGLRLVAPDEGWRQGPDMDPHATRLFRASIVARARFIEDLVAEQVGRGVNQYVILGAGLDSFAQRRPEIASRLRIFEVDRRGPQTWKRQRLIELGFGVPEWLRFVPVDFEAGDPWRDRLETRRLRCRRAGSRGLHRCQHVPRERRDRGHIAPGRCVRPGLHARDDVPAAAGARGPRGAPRASARGGRARASGTPFISFFTPPEMLTLAREAGFRDVRHVSAAALAQRYFAGRTDGLRPPNNSEELLVATS
jgi:O-methyltransferase involved in polyketide biosynthesis